MSNDTTLSSLFEHAKKPPTGGDFPRYPIVYATYVQHSPNSHPPTHPNGADLVQYACGPLTLSADKKTLSGEFKFWMNRYRPEVTNLDTGAPLAPEDAFADSTSNTKRTILIAVTQAGEATQQLKLNGTPVAGMPPWKLDASYKDGMFVQYDVIGVKALSFTLG